jgi:autotransporter-associated beta strand protein
MRDLVPHPSSMIAPLMPRAISSVRWLAVAAALWSSAMAAAPDLTAAGAIASLKADPDASPVYGETYNLGPTGLRGWIYIGGGNGADGTITTESRQILVTVASTPGNAVLAVDDVILGAVAANSGNVPLFTSDARKTFGAAITEAEKSGAGTLRVKRWRTGTITDENIPMTIMGGYTATAPYSCPKSALILTNARTKLVSQLLAAPAPSILTSDWRGAINGLALLAGVTPGDPDYATVQDRLQTYARTLAGTPPQPSGLHIWNWAYFGLFLGEYYLSTDDADVIPGVNNYSVALAQSQSMYGTFGHNAAVLRPDGSGRRSNIGYGPLNQVGIVANMAMAMGKKSLLAAGQPIDPEIDPAIQRGLDFFAWFVNKGPIPYGEHEPFMDGHSPNGKDASCAVLFGLQANRAVETEYFSRMTTAGFTGREYGHTGQGFSYLWGAMGANMGGALAVAEYLKPVRWHLDLSRRTDGSFAYDGQEKYGAGKTTDGTYLGASGYYQMNPTASYILTYSLPLKRLHITGKNANPANTLDTTKVTNAVAAATFKLDCTNQTDFPVSRLISALSEYDPVVRHYAAIELGNRSLSATQLTTLRNLLTGTDANSRMGACQALGLLQDPTALPLIAQRLDKTIEPDSWVRAKAATAIRSYAPDTAGTYCNTMLAHFAANATDPDVIDWNDPVQISNRYLSLALFGDAVKGGNNIATAAIAAPKNLLYPAVQAGLKQPDSYPRHGAAKFCYDRLTLADVQALPLDFIKVIEIESQADRMWGARPRASGIKTLAKHKISEGIPLALAMLEIPKGFEWGSDDTLIGGLNALATYGDAARWTLPALRGYLGKWSPTSSQHTTLVNTIASIEAAITAPAGLTNLMAVANSQVVVTTAAKAITLTGSSPRGAVTFADVSAPAHGTLTGTAPNLTYTPTPGYSGPDFFTFQTADSLTTSAPGTVSIIVGTAGSGLKGEYFDNIDFTDLKLTRTDAQVDFDWGTGPPDAALGADTFSVRWDGLLLVPETGTYTFSTLNSDGVRLYVNGVPVIDGYTDQNTHWNDSAAVNLTAGQMVDLHLRYYENTGSAVAKLKWTGPPFAGANGAIIGSQWLYDGTGMIRTPYAHSQSVALIRNTPQPVTLMGSGGNLTYTVLTPPANGTLTGTAPDLVYTPSANYSGTDSFTFLVNNGTGNSTPATVSIGIWAGQPEDFFWAAAASGNWSGATSWTNAAGTVAVPDSAGQAFYRMNFDRSGTYTATRDLGSGFQLNQLNVAGAVTIAGTNSLNFAANGPMPPQFNQNSASAVAIDVPVALAAMTTFGGSNSGAVVLKGLVSGSGGLTQAGGGTLQIHGLTPNPYSGGTTVNNGTLQLGAVIDNVSPNVVNPVGTGPVTLNGGTIRLEKVTAANALIVNAGRIYHQNGWAATWSGPITLNASLTCDEKSTLNCTGPISGTGGLIKTNSGFVVLSGNNSFTGANQIAAGTLTCNTATALGTGPLDITSGAKINLNFTGTRTIAALTYNGGPPLAPGTYGSTASSATNPNDSYFSGTGTLTILPLTTTTTLASAPSASSTYGDTVTFTAIVSAPGAPATGSVTFKDGGAILGSGSLSLGAATFITDTLPAGNHTITATYEGSGDYSTSISEPLAFTVFPAQTPFEAWAAEPAQGLAAGVNAGPNDDPDHDDIVNLMEFVLGGEPMVSSQVIRPGLANTGGIWEFSFDRSTRSKSTTTLAVEYGSELTGWTPLVIPENSAGAVTITPGTSSDRVKVALPDSGTRLFVRLKVTQ